MSDEAKQTGGVFLPYPLLGILMTLILALGGGIIGMYVKVDTMNATILMRDADQREQLKALRDEQKLQSMYMSDLREKIIRLEERKKGGG